MEIMLTEKQVEKGLRLPEGLSKEDWLEYGKKAKQLEKNLNWFWGDWYAYGQNNKLIGQGKKSELAQEISEISGKSLVHLSRYARACKVVTHSVDGTSVNRENITFTNALEVIDRSHSNDPSNIEHYLELATKMSQKKLRIQIERDRLIEEKGSFPGAILSNPGLDALMERTVKAFNIKNVKEYKYLAGSITKRRVLDQLSQLTKEQQDYMERLFTGENIVKIF